MTPEQAEKKIFIGKQKSPVAIIKRGEISTYLTPELIEYYDIWQKFNSGFGLPYSPNWGDYPDRFTDILSIFNVAWKEATR
ncbi:MAG: hypothetical protein DRI69_10395 [Bacteroidetes bacterium]|nr:MAG: hypothetical protein DRI69_10395 [Bacteroidota bacterium]